MTLFIGAFLADAYCGKYWASIVANFVFIYK